MASSHFTSGVKGVNLIDSFDFDYLRQTIKLSMQMLTILCNQIHKEIKCFGWDRIRNPRPFKF